MTSKYFLVSKYPDDKTPTDIGFEPLGSDSVPKRYLDIKSEIEHFVSFVNEIYKDDKEAKGKYYERIFNLAKLCFSGNDGDYLTVYQAISELKDDVVSHSWVKIRNTLMLKYGLSCIIFSFLFMVLHHFFSEILNNIPMVLAGACLGSWLSFAIRTKNITFNDIYSNYCEGSSPFVRVLYISALTLVTVLLFQSGLIKLDVGGLSTTKISEDVWFALSIGSLLGFGELTLVSSLSKTAKRSLSEK